MTDMVMRVLRDEIKISDDFEMLPPRDAKYEM